jgi:hypothetical protein
MSIFDGLRAQLAQQFPSRMQTGGTVKLQPGNDMMYAGGSPNFNEATGQYLTPPPTGGGSPMIQSPFAGLAGQMNPAGFARPEAQQWLQQALQDPYMAGWGQPQAPQPGNTGIVPPGATGPTGGGQYGGTGVPLTDDQKEQIKKQINAFSGKRRNDALTSFGTSLASSALMGSNPAGMAVGLALQFATQNQGFLNTGVKPNWARKILAEHGYKVAGGGKVLTYMTPDGKRIGGSKLAAELIALIQQYGAPERAFKGVGKHKG